MKLYESGLIQGRAYRVLEHHLSITLKKFDLLIPEWKLLGTISTQRTIQPAQMAPLLGVSRPFITNLINSLIEKKLLESTIHKEDKRFQNISPTKKAEKLLTKIEDKVGVLINSLFEGLTVEERTVYMKVLMKIIINGEKLR